ncbi:MAG TPA: DnaJ C-terminal domain-containing protein [Xanthobacteraceae bacterium]|jgi:DnaJ-class molecular chaperone|nr:DnaJ C-terminal domain-containing protein [Xanthobacteraceae bacterium]
MRNPYDVLGVPRSADAAAIKGAFRRLAKKLHPDANKNDPKAAQRFGELNGAYEILGDEAKRKAFDRGEIDAEGKPRFQGFGGFRGQPGGGGFRPEDFETIFPGGFRRSARGAGAGAGAGTGGMGGFEDLLKGMFGGAAGRRTGFDTRFEPDDFAAPQAGRDVTVPLTISLAEAAKGGTRRVRLPNGKDVDVKIPVGLADGQQIRLKGQGLSGAGGVGDALITVTIAPHPYFTRDGANLRIDVPVTLYEAVLGGKVRVPTLDGAVELAIPAGTSSGRIFRLKGKGLGRKTGGPGDLFATIRIALPERGDKALEDLMREWRDKKPYDPRKDLE